MAKKDVEAYLTQVSGQYHEMKSILDELENGVKGGTVSQETLNITKSNVMRLKENYDRLTYVMYLFNQPTKKKKRKTYENQNKKLLSKIDYKDTKEGVVEENKNTIDQLKELKTQE